MSVLVTPTVAAAPADVTTATTIDTSAFKLGANVLYTAVVYQRHTTPASLGTVTSVVGDLSGAWTPWPTNPTRTYGGASPTGRQTAYWLLSSTDIAETKIRATLSAAQVGARLRVFAIGGTRVASPIVQCVAADSAGASVLTLATPASFLGFADVRNGAIASLMVGANGALTPKINWTEVAETSAATIDTDFQWIGVNDGTANVTSTGSGPISAIAAEIAAPPGAVTHGIVGGGAVTSGAVGTGSGPFVYPSQDLAVRTGRISVLHWTGGNPAGPPGGTPVWSHSFSAGITATRVYYRYDAAAGGENLATAIYHLTSTVDGGTFQTVVSGTTSGGSLKETWQLHEHGNVDVAVNVLAPGLVSLNHTESLSPTAAFAFSSLGFANRENFALLLSSQSTNAGVLTTTEHGWSVNSGLAAGGNCAVISMCRPNSPQSASGANSGHTAHIVVLEFAGLPVTHPPVATLVSPSPPTIAQAASVTIDVTDDDGDLAGVAITANGEPVYTTAGGFVAPYTGSSTSSITNGTRFVISRTAGWLAGSLAINVLATDARAQSRAYSFLWSSVTVPTVHSPVITLVSPSSPGAIGDTDQITLDITDADGDLDLSTVVIRTESTIFSASVFQVPFTVNSSRSPITNGHRFVFRADTPWEGADLAIFVEATDSGGRRTTAFFIWSPLTHPASNPPVITLVSPTEGGIGPVDVITIDVTDADNDLATILAVFGPTSELGYAVGAFGPSFTALSVASTITHGTRLAFKRSGGFALGPLSLTVEATDSEGNTTTHTFHWTVSLPGEAAGDFAAPADGFDDPTEDLFFDDDFELDAADDLLIIDEPESVRQAIIDVARTSPNEYAPRADYGAGIRQLVLKVRTKATLDQARQRLIEALQLDSRVQKVIEVVTQSIQDGIKLYVKAVVAGQQVQFQPIVIKVD